MLSSEADDSIAISIGYTGEDAVLYTVPFGGVLVALKLCIEDVDCILAWPGGLRVSCPTSAA